MTTFTLHTEQSAPEQSRALLTDSKQTFGMLPNLHAVMAESPQLLNAYKEVHALFSNSSFNDDELTVVWQTINVEHECHYCVPAHTAIAKSMGVSDAISTALRDQTPLPSAHLEALRTFTLAMVRNRGQVNSEAISAFISAGYQQRHILDVILGISQKVMSNYTNHLANTPVDAAFSDFVWKKETA